MMKVLSILSLLVVSFLGAFLWIADKTPSSYATKTTRGQRDPAAIRRVYDFSNLDGQDLSSASKKRLITGFDVVKESSNLGVSLGHFVVSSSDGKKQFACDRYSHITLLFEGEGVAVNGDKPMMEVEGVCVVDADINRISPLWIPIARILGNPASDGEIDFSQDPEHVKLRFKNVSDQWPMQWVLTKVQLTSPATKDEVSIDRGDLRAMMNRPVVLDFSTQ